jgi:hypothetical protein
MAGKQRLMLIGAFASALSCEPVIADAASPEESSSTDDSGLDTFQPPPDSFQSTLSYRTKPDTTREVTSKTLDLRYVHAIQLGPFSILAFRGDLPLSAKNPINASNPTGDFVYGLGDVDFQLTAIRAIDARWTIGFGARVYAPTGNENVASGNWRIMPLGGFRYALPEINSYFEPILRYSQTLTDAPGERGPSNLQFAPKFNVNLPDSWFVTLYPSADIRWDLGQLSPGQTGRLFLPFVARVGRKISKRAAVSVEVGVPIIKDYPVYDLKTQLRLSVSF